MSSVALASALACTTPAPLVDEDILVPLVPTAAIQPTDSDVATRDLARAALLTDHDRMEASLTTLREIATLNLEPERSLARRIPMSVDLRNATITDPIEYREACRSLKGRKDNDPRLESRLEQCAEDDSLRLARRRELDTQEALWAETYNAVAAPLSRSLLSGGILTPYYMANSAATYLARINERDAFPVQLRQALAHRQAFVAHFPDSELAPKVREKIENATAKLHREETKKLLFQANVALKNQNIRMANVLAKRALHTSPANKKAAKLVVKTSEAIAEQRAGNLRSESATIDFSKDKDADFAAKLLLAESDLGLRGISISRHPEYADVGAYVVATALAERGDEIDSWERLRDLAGQSIEKSAMARHARSLVRDPAQNPYGSFERVRAAQGSKRARWHVFGPFFQGPRYRRLPTPIAWTLDLPLLLNTVLFSPVRFIFSPVSEIPNFDKPISIAAYRYLDRKPGGEHQDELSRWLYDYEFDLKNWNAALRMADYVPSVSTSEREELVEKAAGQQIEAANRSKRRDRKNSTLRHAAREFPDSNAGRRAGIAARDHRDEATAQSIRMTRSFLVENPQVSGPRALGIRPALIDGDNRNGELHPRGVTFIGGRFLEFDFLAESGDEDDPPNKVRQKITEQRLVRLVSILDDTARRNYRVDPDVELAADPRRDLFIERARLGLADDPDVRVTAQSTYVFESARERFGMVRGRESILPFDLVVRGDFTSAGIAAFPRWRMPKETPDAFLYR
ncbi:MAG: hypothetical protein ACI8W3_000345 [Myxococcota bacterium]|jgi:hypothetical protein